MACYVPHPATSHGSGHRKCADTCLKKGMPMGLLTEDKQLYLLLEDHDNPKPYAQLKEQGRRDGHRRGDEGRRRAASRASSSKRSRSSALEKKRCSSTTSSSVLSSGSVGTPLLIRYWMRGWITRLMNGSAPIA